MTDIKRSEDLPYSHCQAMEDGKKNINYNMKQKMDRNGRVDGSLGDRGRNWFGKKKINLQSPSLLSDDLYLDISNIVFQPYSWKGWG